MRVATAHVGACIVDSLPFSQTGTFVEAQNLVRLGADGLAGYLGVINKQRLNNLLAAGLAFIPVTLAGAYNDGANDELAQLKALGIPKGATVYVDMEGLIAFKTEPQRIIYAMDSWANAIKTAGYIPGLYVGSPQPLTSEELWKLKVERYWKGQGSCRDRNGDLAEPRGCGWGMTQMWPSVTAGGVLVDWNMVGADYLSRMPSWVVA